MLTELQLAAALDSLEPPDRLILVGDHRQLPPIGAGRPYVDIVRRLLPENVDRLFPRIGRGYAELTVMRRQRVDGIIFFLPAGSAALRCRRAPMRFGSVCVPA